MHIVQILPELNQGGVERGTVELNRELVKRGHQSTVISAGGTQAAQIEKDGGRHITLDVCSKNPFTFPFRVFALRKTLQKLMSEKEIGGRRTEVNVVRLNPEGESRSEGTRALAGHTHYKNQSPATSNQPPAPTAFKFPVSNFKFPSTVLHARSRIPAWLCHFANKKLKIPFVTTVHGFNSVSRYSEIMTSGDRVIYGSTAIKDYVLENYSVDESKLRYVPRGIDTAHFDPNKVDASFVNDFKQQYELNGKTVITIVGRITEWKGHDTFIRALAEVQKTHPDIVGVVAGGIWHGKETFFQGLEKLADELGADIRFVGSQTQVREIYALSDLVVSAASTKAETFGRTAAEALAMNTPVIASAHGGSLDILLDGENGLLFRPGDAADLTNKIEQSLAFNFKNMRGHIEQHFSLNRMTEDELIVCKELIESQESRLRI